MSDKKDLAKKIDDCKKKNLETLDLLVGEIIDKSKDLTNWCKGNRNNMSVDFIIAMYVKQGIDCPDIRKDHSTYFDFTDALIEECKDQLDKFGASRATIEDFLDRAPVITEYLSAWSSRYFSKSINRYKALRYITSIYPHAIAASNILIRNF